MLAKHVYMTFAADRCMGQQFSASGSVCLHFNDAELFCRKLSPNYCHPHNTGYCKITLDSRSAFTDALFFTVLALNCWAFLWLLQFVINWYQKFIWTSVDTDTAIYHGYQCALGIRTGYLARLHCHIQSPGCFHWNSGDFIMPWVALGRVKTLCLPCCQSRIQG